MGSQQLSYPYAPPAGFPGMFADSGPHDCVTVGNGEASAEIPFGVMVAKHATVDNKGILPAASNAVMLGVLVHDHSYAVPNQLGTTGIKPKMPLALCRAGRVWVTTEEAVNKGDQCYIRYASGSGGTQLGAFRKSADTSTAVATTYAYFHTTTAVAGIVQVQIGVPI